MAILRKHVVIVGLFLREKRENRAAEKFELRGGERGASRGRSSRARWWVDDGGVVAKMWMTREEERLGVSRERIHDDRPPAPRIATLGDPGCTPRQPSIPPLPPFLSLSLSNQRNFLLLVSSRIPLSALRYLSFPPPFFLLPLSSTGTTLSSSSMYFHLLFL